MVINKYFSKVQSLLGISKSELTFAIMLFVGMAVWIFANLLGYTRETGHTDTGELKRIIDSVAEAHLTTYIGSDIKDNPLPKLQAGDTIVRKKQFYPQKRKPALPTGKVDLNTASKTALMQIPGVGGKTAVAIIEFREKHKFSKIDDIMRIKGIGVKKFEKMKQYITVK